MFVSLNVRFKNGFSQVFNSFFLFFSFILQSLSADTITSNNYL